MSYNLKYFNFTEIGELKADDINFGFAFTIIQSTKKGFVPIDIASIDPRYITFRSN